MSSPANDLDAARGAGDARVPDAARVLVDFVPTKRFFAGIDSDGCAMDAMDIKHQECFTPCYIRFWDLQPISTLARQTALFVNLGSISRGLNRWLALKQVLDLLRDRTEVAERGFVVPDYPELTAFVESSFPLSDQGFAAWAELNPSPTARRMLAWSEGVNAAIADMVHGCGPFPGVREAMAAMYDSVDEMTVSATPVEALEREWSEHGLARYMRVIAGQEMGGKAEHVRYAAVGKYGRDHILLIGDAPGDRVAAAEAGCLFYPILPGAEARSWRRFTEEALPAFLQGEFAGAYQEALVAEFTARLPDRVPWETISGRHSVAVPRRPLSEGTGE
ncbi:MAG TPA: HAD family hydrolase [Propionibacteriaceae bacterium]|nr:HAD family hydrolase [Propionibacteriaceae bacterium]